MLLIYGMVIDLVQKQSDVEGVLLLLCGVGAENILQLYVLLMARTASFFCVAKSK